MPDIFIGYANADRERARQLADQLTTRGYSVGWDRTMPPGRVFDEVLQAAEGIARGILVPALIGEVSPPIVFKRIQSASPRHKTCA